MSLIGGLFGGLADFAEAGGDLAEANAYSKAQHFAMQNAVISQEAGDIKLEQTNRQIYKTIGAQQAGYAGAGLASGGSAQAVLRDSVSQGSLQKAIVNEQTAINVTGYKEQAAQFKGMKTAADAAAAGAALKGIGSILGGFLSDRRLKRDIEQVGRHGELGLYRYRFIGEDEVRVGVMADEVAVYAPHALGPTFEGYATVNYGRLGLAHLVGGQGA